VTCWCGCGKHWALSRGRLARTPAVVIATRHGAERVAWIGLAVGGSWVALRSARSGEHAAATIVDPDQSPFAALGLAGTWLPRARVIDDSKHKTGVFALHDALLPAHPDLRALFTELGRDYSFAMPDCAFALPPAERSPRTSQNFAECGSRLFVRALLPIPISDGSELRIGLWHEVSAEQFFAVMRVFWDDAAEYMRQRVDGQVESSLEIAGHDVRGARVTLGARSADQCMFVISATPDWLAALLRDGVSAAALPELVADFERVIARHDPKA